MNTKSIFVLALLFSFSSFSVAAQKQEWQRFVPLETSRAEVEKLLGKPVNYFETFGVYKTDFGRFNVWYSTGRCEKKNELQYKVKPQILTQLQVYLPTSFSLADFVWDIKSFRKYKPFENDDRVYYSSMDESLGYVVGRRGDGTEFLFTATIEPERDKKKRLICEEARDLID